MPLDQNALAMIANPTGGKLSEIGQTLAKNRQQAIENERQAAEDKRAQQTHLYNMADLGSKEALAYTDAMKEWDSLENTKTLKANFPERYKEEFHKVQTEYRDSLQEAAKSFIPEEYNDTAQINMVAEKTLAMQKRFHPELYKEKEKKSSFEVVKLEKLNPITNEMEEKTFHKDDKERVRKHLDDKWNVVSGKGDTIILNQGEISYSKKRLEQEAIRITEAADAAESAYNNIQSLKRFKDASKEGYQGALQPVMTGARNLLASFGYDSEKLKDVRFMQQSIGEILAQYMEELGARGLTDNDMKILATALPRAETDKASREAIADVLIKSNSFKISEWEHNMKEEKRIWPDIADKIKQPYWHSLYKEQQENQGTFNKADAILRDSQSE